MVRPTTNQCTCEGSGLCGRGRLALERASRLVEMAAFTFRPRKCPRASIERMPLPGRSGGSKGPGHAPRSTQLQASRNHSDTRSRGAGNPTSTRARCLSLQAGTPSRETPGGRATDSEGQLGGGRERRKFSFYFLGQVTEKFE